MNRPYENNIYIRRRLLVKLRLRRMGKKQHPMYKIVAADSRAARTGKYLESIGSYIPTTNPMTIDVKEDRLFYWLKNGAQPSDTVRSLLRRKGLWLRWDLMKKGADEATIAAQFEKWQMLQTEKLQRETEKKARRKATHKMKAARKSEQAAPTPQSGATEESKPAEEATPPQAG